MSFVHISDFTDKDYASVESKLQIFQDEDIKLLAEILRISDNRYLNIWQFIKKFSTQYKREFYSREVNIVYPDYNSVAKRLDSFKNPSFTKHLNITHLANTGFFYKDDANDSVVCFSCGLELKNLTFYDIPLVQHAKSIEFGKKCNYLLYELGEKIIDYYQNANAEKDDFGYKLSDELFNSSNYYEELKNEYVKLTAESVKAFAEKNKPIFNPTVSSDLPKLADEFISEPTAAFDSSKSDDPSLELDLLDDDSTFIYSNLPKPQKCYSCGFIIKSWRLGDLWIDHAKSENARNCKYLQTVWGDDFVSLYTEKASKAEATDEKAKAEATDEEAIAAADE